MRQAKLVGVYELAEASGGVYVTEVRVVSAL